MEAVISTQRNLEEGFTHGYDDNSQDGGGDLDN
jgi:hypothetical protein